MKHPICDPHLHFFDLNKGEYLWLRDENPPHWPGKSVLREQTFEQDLSQFDSIELQGYVHIEAGFNNHEPIQELIWLQGHCKKPMRSIAFLDLRQENADFESSLISMLEYPSFIGIRHIVDDELLNAMMASGNVKQNLLSLSAKGVVFELQVDVREQLTFDALFDVLSCVPSMPISINHAGFAPLNDDGYQLWRRNLAVLADLPSCYVKVSGLEMQDPHFGRNDLIRVLRDCVHIFGQERVMLASNFPVLKLACGYQSYWEQVIEVCKVLDLDSQALACDNAKRFYSLP